MGTLLGFIVMMRCAWCLVGAVNKVVNDIIEIHGVFRVLSCVADMHVSKFNDKPYVTHYDVINLLEQGLEKAKGELDENIRNA